MNAREIAASLTKGSRRALPHLGEDWRFVGRPRWLHDGVYSLGWATDACHRLIEVRWDERGSLEARLRALGLEVRTILQEQKP